MNEMAWTYVAYLGITIGITIWVARTLRRFGVVLMTSANSDEPADPRASILNEATSHLLIVGFYLINLGVISFALKSYESVRDTQTAIELLSSKVGTILVVLGGMHFLILTIFASHRKRDVTRPTYLRVDGLNLNNLENC